MSSPLTTDRQSLDPESEQRKPLVSGSGVQSRKCPIAPENILLICTVIGVVTGIGLGIGLRGVDPPFSARHLSYLRFPGDLFLRMLQMLILPLIVSSIISSLSSLDSGTAGRIGFYALLYYFTTTMGAVLLGIVLVVAIQPGHWTKNEVIPESQEDAGARCISTAIDTILDLVRNMFPDNLVAATFQNQKTCTKFENVTGNVTTVIPAQVAIELSTEERKGLDEIPDSQTNDGMNIMGLVMFSVAFGIVISRMGEKGAPLKHFFQALEGAMMTLISLVIWYSPIGITFLIAEQICKMDDPAKELHRLAGYMVTVLTGLFIHGGITLPLLLVIFARRNPFKFVYGMLQALLTAFGTSSSSATLPLSIKCVEEHNGVDPRVSRFVLPLGATINMDGTALYEAVAAIYIAQTVGRDLSIGGIILVSLTATLASVGAAGIPQAGIVTMIMVLIAIGIPTRHFVLIIPVDFFLDRIRTTVNVHGDSIGCAIVEKLCEEQLRHSQGPEEEQMVDLTACRFQDTNKDSLYPSVANEQTALASL